MSICERYLDGKGFDVSLEFNSNKPSSLIAKSLADKAIVGLGNYVIVMANNINGRFQFLMTCACAYVRVLLRMRKSFRID